MARLNLKPAASGMSHHKYDVSTIASLDFGELLPVRVIETIKRDHFTQVQANGILRLSPQVFPAYGKCFVKSAAFFVPEYQIFEASDAFHSNMKTWKGNNVILPYFWNYNINALLQDIRYSTLVASVTGPSSSNVPAFDSYDFVYVPFSDPLTFKYYKLNRAGEYRYKILKSLGYEFCSYSFESGFNRDQVYQSGMIQYNALPLLAYLKVYCDFFLNPQLYNDSPLVSLLNCVQFGKDFIYSGNTLFTASTGVVSKDCLDLIFNFIFVPHQGSYYLDAWNSPNSPDGVSPNTTLLSKIPDRSLIGPYLPEISSSYRDSLNADTSSTYLDNVTSSSSITNLRYLTNFGLALLQKFDKFVKRRGISGNKAVERIYSMFGIKSDFFSSHYCHKIFDSASRIDFNPVLSNSNTTSSIPGQSGTSLGSYAGYASSGLNFNFEHKCDSFGYIICLTWIQVVPMLMHGCDPSVLRSSPFDFYTPDYDGATVRAIPHCEVSYAKSGLASVTNGSSSKKVFGYFNLYDDYRFMKDTIVGDFITSVNAKNFLFGRDISVFYQSGLGGINPQNNGIHYWLGQGVAGANSDMTNPFQLDASNGDRFYLQLDFHIEADRPIKSETESLDLNGEGDMSFSMNGNSLS